MASRTQLRLGQITGSFGDVEGGIVDNLAFDSNASIEDIGLTSGSMVGVMSEIASAIKRINGAATFAGATAGEFGHAIVPDSDLGQDLGTSSVHWGTLHVGQVDATGITGSLRDTSISNTQVAFADAANTLVGDSNFTWNGTLLTLGGASQGTSQLSVSGDATITGDLTVSGVTTTLDTTNLLVEDPVILLAKAASGNSTNGGIAIEQGKASGTGDMVFGRVDDDTWGVGTKDTSGGTVTTLADMTLGPMRAGKFEVDSANNYIDVVSSDLTAVAAANILLDATTDIILDAAGNDIFFKANGTTFGKIAKSTDQLILSGGIGDAIVLDANSGEVNFDSSGTRYATLLEDGGGFELAANQSGNNSFKIAAAGTGNADVFAGTGGMVRLGVGGDHLLNMTASAGSVQIRAAADGGDDSKDIIFTNEDYSTEIFRVDTSAHTLAMPQQNAAGNDATAGLLSFNGTTDVNEAIYGDGGALYLRSNAVNFKMPTADAAASGYAIVSDGAGTLSFAAVGSDAVTKGIKIIGASGVSAGTAVNFNAVDAGSTVSGLSTAETQGKSLDVFVNGQLLVSGSESERAAGSRDYAISSGTELKFAFALEQDDVVQLIKR